MSAMSRHDLRTRLHALRKERHFALADGFALSLGADVVQVVAARRWTPPTEPAPHSWQSASHSENVREFQSPTRTPMPLAGRLRGASSAAVSPDVSRLPLPKLASVLRSLASVDRVGQADLAAAGWPMEPATIPVPCDLLVTLCLQLGRQFAKS